VAALGGCANEEVFEKKQTEKMLGISVLDFPRPQGTTGLDTLPARAPQFSFTLTRQKPSGPKPRDWYESRPRVFAKAPDGSTFEAFCGRTSDKELQPGHRFVSTLGNRRHRYPNYLGHAYYPSDVVVGRRVKGKLKPLLFFRDVGSHNDSPHALAVDAKGRCHLMVADVFIEQENRLKLYWLIGNQAKGKWEKAWLVHRRPQFNYWVHPRCAAWGKSVHLVWAWGGDNDTGGIGYLQWTPKGFSKKLRLTDRLANNLDLAVDSDSGRLVLVFSKGKGVFVQSRSPQGKWTKPTRLSPRLKKEYAVSIQASGKGKFVIRLKWERMHQFLIRVR
jgi:hypothetical protein